MAATKQSGALSALKVKPMYGEAIDEDDDVDEAMRRVMDAYTARQQRNYDPSLMAIGQGLLASRGNFGEAVGMASKSYEDMQAKLRQEEIDTSAANLQLAQSRRDQALMRQKTKAQSGLFGAESGDVGPADGMDVDPDAFKLMVAQGADPEVAYRTLQTSANPAGKRSGITAEKIQDYLYRFGPGPEVDAAIKLLVAQDASKQFKDGVLIDTRAGTATRLLPVGLPEVGLDIKDTPTIGGTYPMDSRTRMLYSHVASTGGKDAATKFMQFYKESGVAPPDAEKSYNTTPVQQEIKPGQLDVSLIRLSSKLNSIKDTSDPKQIAKLRLTPIEAKVYGALNRITEARGNLDKLSDFDKQVFESTARLMEQRTPIDLKESSLTTERPAEAPAVPKAVAPEAAAAPAAVVAPKAVVPAPVAAPAPAVPVAAAPPAPVAAKAAAAPAPAANTAVASVAAAAPAALPPPPVPIPYPALPSGVLSAQQIAERDSQIKAIDKKNDAAMEAWKLQYGTAAKDRERPLELEQKKKELEQAAAVAADVEARKDFALRRKEADETITIANIFRRFSEDPNAQKMFGILNNDKISSGIATLVKEGIGLPGFTVGTKSIEDIMRNAGLSAADQAKYRTFLTYTAMMQLQAQKYMKGAVSENEQKLLANSGISAQDTPASIRMKADLLSRRAQFDRRAAKEFKKSKMTAEDFLDSDKYLEMRDKYDVDLADLVSGSKILVAPPKASASGRAEPSPGFIRDSKTGVYRLKKPGE